MIHSIRKGLFWCLLLLLGGRCEPGTAQDRIDAAVQGGQSDYVKRMMSLDRNGDGRLAREELPGKLAEMLKHDSNGDTFLDAAELLAIESGAKDARIQGSQSQGSSARMNRNGPSRRGTRQLPQGQAGSPLDPAQIIRFALTFDADRDGGLNADELKRYAIALAARRARGRRRSGTLNTGRPTPESSEHAPKGLGSPGSKDDPGNPFGAKSK